MWFKLPILGGFPVYGYTRLDFDPKNYGMQVDYTGKASMDNDAGKVINWYNTVTLTASQGGFKIQGHQFTSFAYCTD